MRVCFILFSLSVLQTPTHAQFHDNTWLSGYEGGVVSPNDDRFGITVLDFTEGSLRITDNQEIGLEFYITAFSMSDSSGKLLFYTNGIDVEDVSWNTMQNGANIHPDVLGGLTISQGVLGLQYPGKKNQYALLHVPRGYVGFPLNTVGSLHLFYTRVDMEQNGGLGAVMEKSVPLLSDTLMFGKLKSAKHANGRDWWVLVPEAYTNNIYRFLFDPDGFHLIGKQAIGAKLYPGVGQAVFSPDGARYVLYDTYVMSMPDVVGVYDFDRCTGMLSNHRRIELGVAPLVAGGATFSPNSRYLYVHSTLVVAQYDLLASDLAASRVELGWYDGYESPFPTHFFAGQLAPDGKIYMNTSNGTDVLHVIHRPDEAGAAAMLEQHGIRIPTYNASSMNNYPNYRLGPLDGSPCDTLGIDNHPKAWWRYEQDTLDALAVSFRDLSYYEPAIWAWNFGDSSPTSSTRHPQHQYAQPGAYQVCLTVSNHYGTDTHCKMLYLGVTAQENPVLQAQVQVWPNPFRERFAVAVSSPLLGRSRGALRLYNAAGRLVMEQRLVLGVNEIETRALPAGLYVWEIVAGGERVKSGKIAKSRE
ncbi:MAG: PKD domain-containing protein [Saprospiraceae bacterium]|jgi:hypothetical protein|nr:PKD domain-containing protein [Saprospiraceae bacterium]